MTSAELLRPVQALGHQPAEFCSADETFVVIAADPSGIQALVIDRRLGTRRGEHEISHVEVNVRRLASSLGNRVDVEIDGRLDHSKASDSGLLLRLSKSG